jgi:nucleolar protein TMA23
MGGEQPPSNLPQSTLNQIRTKGINRGGLYGFFVKGEAIAGTIEDSSATATDASIPPSGASTPPTSASESEAPAIPKKISDKKNKRKREADDAPQELQKAKKPKTKREKPKKAKPVPGDDTVARKIAKLSPRKKERYEARAAAKGQTIEQYISRRIYKKSAFRASTKLNAPAAAPESADADAPAAFFTDLEGDATLVQPTTSATPAQSAAVEDASADESDGPPKPDPIEKPKKVKKVRKAHQPSDTPTGKKAHKAMIREKRLEKKERKKEHRAERLTRSKSK